MGRAQKGTLLCPGKAHPSGYGVMRVQIPFRRTLLSVGVADNRSGSRMGAGTVQSVGKVDWLTGLTGTTSPSDVHEYETFMIREHRTT